MATEDTTDVPSSAILKQIAEVKGNVVGGLYEAVYKLKDRLSPVMRQEEAVPANLSGSTDAPINNDTEVQKALSDLDASIRSLTERLIKLHTLLEV